MSKSKKVFEEKKIRPACRDQCKFKCNVERNISKALKSSPIFLPDQYITLIKIAKKTGTPYNVFELTHDNFWNLKSLADAQCCDK